jgi:hypothetical protein
VEAKIRSLAIALLGWRPSRTLNWAVSVENPEQQIGSGAVTLPSCCAYLADQYNDGSAGLSTPNLMPDIVSRVALNHGDTLHVDGSGASSATAVLLFTQIRYNLP